MYLPMSWLKDFVNIDCSVEEFADKMTLSGSKVETIENRGKEITNVVVGKVLEIEKHPDADRLLVVKVDISKNEPLQVVTGATNLFVGAYVPVALDGATLAKGVKIKKGKLRGVISEGMFCSVEEFGFSRNEFPEAPENGIYIFNKEYPLGSDIKEIFKIDEDVVEFEITSNRPDCFSILGLAREAAATFKQKLNLPNISIRSQLNENINDIVKINVENSELCPRYSCRVIKNVKIQPSPDWLKYRLIACGIRPINNIVDITNYVMLEIGQPMHAFNLNHISGNEMNIRLANDNEKMITLDGIERNLDKSMLIISDKDKIIDLAGIMGGENSMITSDATTVLLEAASFNGVNIRLTSKKLGLRTDASTKYEKCLDPNLTIIALDRACHLIQMLECGEVVDSLIDIYPNKVESFEFEYSNDRINNLLGTNLTENQIIDFLKLVEVNANGKVAKIPTFRQDLQNDADLAEEVARFYGYDNIETTFSTGKPTVGKKNYKQQLTDLVYNTMISMGVSECLSYSFEGTKVFDKLKINKDSYLRNVVTISNPLGEDFSIMRTTTLNSMLQSISTNFNRRNPEVSLFEIGKVYLPKSLPLKELPNEKEILTVAMYGNIDFFDIKGIFENLFEVLGLTNKIDFEKNENISFMHPTRTANINIKTKNNLQEIGYLGELNPNIASNYNIETKVYIGVIELEKIFENANINRTYKELPKYPSMQRDLAMVVKDDVTAKEIEQIIRKNSGQFLEKIRLFDVYKGSQIKEGYKSVAYNITFRANDRTLTEQDLEQPMKKILSELEKNLNAQLR